MLKKQSLQLLTYSINQILPAAGNGIGIRPCQKALDFSPHLVVRGLSSMFIKARQLPGGDVPGERAICTTSCLEKRQSPLTVQTPRWKKAAIERRQLLTQLRKPKSLDTLKAEIKLATDPVNISLCTTTRIQPLPEEIETVTRLKPEIFLSRDEQMIVCYHPAPLYPKQNTKESYVAPEWHGNPIELADYSDVLTEEQESEVKSLMGSDSNLWTATVLGHMMKVKPGVISEKFPYTREQQTKYHLERNMLQEWGKVKRMNYRKYQFQERIEYIKKTRGEEAVVHFKGKFKV